MTSLRWRRHRWLIIGTVAGLIILAAGFGNVRLAAITSSERTTAGTRATIDIAGTTDLFDTSVVHELKVTFDPAEYAQMIKTYQEEGEKEYIQAAITIDGTTIAEVGLRLKGNSTLMSLRTNGERGGGGPGGQGGAGGGATMRAEIEACLTADGTPVTEANPDPATTAADADPAAATAASPIAGPAGAPPAGDPGEDRAAGNAPAAPAADTAASIPAAGGTSGIAAPATGDQPGAEDEPGADARAAGGAGGFGGMMGSIDVDDPTTMPWLIRFDEIVDGQRYQGLREIAIRPTIGGETNLNEALAQALVGAAGEPTELTSYVAFRVNDSEPRLRLALEVPGDVYAERNFGSDGVLYKAAAGSRFAYLGDDPTLYDGVFQQETAEHRQDLAPLIAFLKWETEATDAEFAAELADHLDVESFARYVALQELLSNFDDMAGPGSNYYLWYDLETQRFTVLTWDLNLALSSGGGFGGGQGAPGGPGGGMMTRFAEIDEAKLAGCLPSGVAERIGGPGGSGDQAPGGGGGGGRGFGSGNDLKTRFLAAPEFADLYATAYAGVYAALYGNDGAALTTIDQFEPVLRASDLVDAATVTSEAGALRATVARLAAAGPVPANSTVATDLATPAAATPAGSE